MILIRNKFALFLFLFLINFTFAQNDAFIQLASRGEVYLKFKPSSQPIPESVLNAISIDHGYHSEWITAYANESGFLKLREYTNDIEILTPPSLIYKPEMKSAEEIKSISDWDFYPTYEAYVDIMYQFAADHPNMCSVFSIGQTEEGRELLIARISDNAGIDEGEAQFLYTSTMHGDETTGYVLMLHLIDYLLTNYGSNAQVTNIVNNLDIWINPLANPDGTYFGGNSTVYSSRRYNANNVDLNRNYADPDDGPHPDGNAYQAETEAFMAMAEENHFVIAANFHGGAEVFNYPWDTWSQLHADDEWWQFVGREWADTAHVYSPAGYMNDLENGITNGYAWYTTTGSRQDYMNYYHHCREVTLEISSVKLVQESALPDFWDYNYHSFLNYMEQALFGIRGQVTDEQTGDPVQASVVIEGHDELNTWVVSGKDDGWYFRPIFEGEYELTFFAPHYEPKVIAGVEAINYLETALNVALKPTDSDIEENKLENLFVVGPNPVKDKLSLKYNGSVPLNTQIVLINLSGKILWKDHHIWNTNNKEASIPINLRAGEYILNIIGEQSCATFKIIQP